MFPLYRNNVKFVLDTLTSLMMLVVTFPIFISLMICLFFSNKGCGVFYFQTRPGKNAKLFKIIKFKTMSDEKDQFGNYLPDANRLTKIGKFLRSTSLDELPQLINVLKGDMSFVGPRPLLPKYLPLYNDYQARRHTVKPGITGWTQVNGRNSISWDKKLEMDVWYVDNISFVLDIKILFLTLVKVLKREGINAVDSVSGVPFTGNDK